jgi:hypothetical protein
MNTSHTPQTYPRVETASHLVSLHAFYVGQRECYDADTYVLTLEGHAMDRIRHLHLCVRGPGLHTIHVFPPTTRR